MDYNATHLHELALIRLTGYENGYLTLALSLVMAIMLGPAILFFIRDHQQPMIKYRTWTLNILACISATVSLLCMGLINIGNLLEYKYVIFCEVFSNILFTIVVCSFFPTYLRHYFLLKLPVLQQQLLNSSTFSNPKKRADFFKNLVWTKFLSSERGAWTVFAINVLPCQIMTIYFSITADYDKWILNMPNDLSVYLGIMPLIQIVLSQVFLLWYGPRSPKDNYHIMTQFYIITGLTLADVMVLAISNTQNSHAVSEICNSIFSILTFLAVFVDIVVPLQFLVTKKRYATDLSDSSTHQFRSRSKPHSCKPNSISSRPEVLGTSKLGLDHESTVTDVPSNQTVPLNTSPTHMLQSIFEKPEIYSAFCTFLSREFAMESLLFIEAVKRYKSQLNENLTLSLVESLSDKIQLSFIEPNAVNEINLPKKTVDKLNAHLQEIINQVCPVHKALTVYDEAASYIEQMLVVNHLRKFHASTLFQKAATLS
ncbi:hypothetical protein QVD99_008518 [Batrachochytrium dendrobatidis]|nr:hypothetical protein O5D80_007387 [Batrachochytrium dendrobatidis]KAK5664983.1 hypothetical protein QVD99_008518 [Batrachochytrium dendrobatidis]